MLILEMSVTRLCFLYLIIPCSVRDSSKSNLCHVLPPSVFSVFHTFLCEIPHITMFHVCIFAHLLVKSSLLVRYMFYVRPKHGPSSFDDFVIPLGKLTSRVLKVSSHFVPRSSRLTCLTARRLWLSFFFRVDSFHSSLFSRASQSCFGTLRLAAASTRASCRFASSPFPVPSCVSRSCLASFSDNFVCLKCPMSAKSSLRPCFTFYMLFFVS